MAAAWRSSTCAEQRLGWHLIDDAGPGNGRLGHPAHPLTPTIDGQPPARYDHQGRPDEGSGPLEAMPSPVDELVQRMETRAEAAGWRSRPWAWSNGRPGHYAIDLDGPPGWAGVVSAPQSAPTGPGIARLAYPAVAMISLICRTEAAHQPVARHGRTPNIAGHAAALPLVRPADGTGYAVVAGVGSLVARVRPTSRAAVATDRRASSLRGVPARSFASGPTARRVQDYFGPRRSVTWAPSRPGWRHQAVLGLPTGSRADQLPGPARRVHRRGHGGLALRSGNPRVPSSRLDARGGRAGHGRAFSATIERQRGGEQFRRDDLQR